MDLIEDEGSSTSLAATTSSSESSADVTSEAESTDEVTTEFATSGTGSSEESTGLTESCGDGVQQGGEECDEGVDNGNGTSSCTASCTSNLCGDGYEHTPTEECDLGADNGSLPAPCSNACNDQYPVVQIAVGYSHTCALVDTGAVRCWGGYVLGYGNTDTIGDDETPASAGDVDVGGTVVEIAAGAYHTCARLDTGTVRCWGAGGDGQLGYGNTEIIGDDETPAAAGDVDVGGVVVEISAGDSHTCARLDTGTVRCWGTGDDGRLGYGNQDSIGDDETPASVGDVDVGGVVSEIAAGGIHTCARLDTGAVRCWGRGDLGFGVHFGLGYGNTNAIGDDETPSSAGDVDVGGIVVQLVTGDTHTCARLDTGAVRCWGSWGDPWTGEVGKLGYPGLGTIGDDETPASAGDVDVGGIVMEVVAGYNQTCARLDRGGVRCWGFGGSGGLGYGDTANVEAPASAGDVNVGGTVVELSAGGATCARLDTGAVRCWGHGGNGWLGYGNTDNIGDDEDPASAGDVPIF